ncbi:Ferredoxin subunit of nitrite reductase or a ring-hydroxylating dioxygenase [Paenibacillus sp. UNCCL117]|uniref:Rieske (2Fe-2S) protein n=1 Tax=unclassified Paenibacillus TaxID=185978 RepID=UPI000884CC45|nr:MULTISPECIES: Rieske (2Fe-2S) protein [unclassified Paenibacillus]SDD13425.1 Ferredoxin subunit of nitrite reductase or a ring-hydroxylating dioxygenase [Paenibacillus sp. cl123]SFW33985.1 Ferredoxin subunit of nitrite reductase or a ring-hydroxylating dioxygenase [Paenibacillus sp. UNCCL117]
MAVYDVLHADDVPEGGSALVRLEGREIVVYRVGGQYYALNNYCPHQGAPMCAGLVSGTTEPAGVYEYAYGREGEIVRCPWHGWEFDIKTGKSLFSERTRVKSYRVEVRDGRIGIVLGERGTAP